MDEVAALKERISVLVLRVADLERENEFLSGLNSALQHQIDLLEEALSKE